MPRDDSYRRRGRHRHRQQRNEPFHSNRKEDTDERRRSPHFSPRGQGRRDSQGRPSTRPNVIPAPRLLAKPSKRSFPLKVHEKETDPRRLAQRQKQIDFGKNTIGYDNYCKMVPKHERVWGKHPVTPDKTKKMSKRCFDGIVRKWRQMLHTFDDVADGTYASPQSVVSHPSSNAHSSAPSSANVSTETASALPSQQQQPHTTTPEKTEQNTAKTAEADHNVGTVGDPHAESLSIDDRLYTRLCPYLESLNKFADVFQTAGAVVGVLIANFTLQEREKLLNGDEASFANTVLEAVEVVNPQDSTIQDFDDDNLL